MGPRPPPGARSPLPAAAAARRRCGPPLRLAPLAAVVALLLCCCCCCGWAAATASGDGPSAAPDAAAAAGGSAATATAPGGGGAHDAVHITAILGESVVFNCHVEFPEGQPVPYVLQWEKKMRRRALIEYFLKGQDIPIYIWYESYPTHSGEGYEGRVSRVPSDSPYGAASLNLTNIRESDQGWYECKVVFLNRAPGQQRRNGTWFHLEVHAPPRFVSTPERYVYVNAGDAVILSCQAEGAPAPEIVWYKDDAAVQPSPSVGVFNDGTELRIANIRAADIGDYTCIARNGEGQVTHTAELVAAGPAVITVPPSNQTRLEGDKVEFACEAKGQPGNITVRWFREGAPVRELQQLESRVAVRRDGALVVNPVAADDAGQYLCEVSNGIGEPQSASAYLNVEYPAKVTFTPSVQYLPFRLAGVVQCHIRANPPLQYVTWTKDKRLLEPYQTKDIVIMNNGSLLFTRVNEGHAGRYTCTPYNAQGTQGSSGQMEVLVRKPPVFTVEPEAMYQRKVGDSVEMHCDAQEAEGTQKPTIAWQRRDGTPLPKNRVKVFGGNITLEGLRRADFGFYQCVASNEVATIVTAAQLVVEGTQPHAPYNLTALPGEFSVTLGWLPGYSGGPDYKQDYTIWYREAGGAADWATIPVTPPGSTRVTIGRLAPATAYEFQVVGKNALGDGMMSQVVTARTLDVGLPHVVGPVTPTPFLTPNDDSGPKPGVPRNLTVTEVNNGFLITWQAPAERAGLVQHYVIKYRTDGPYKTLNKAPIRPEDTHYLVKNLVGGRTYYFQILAVAADGTSLGPDDAVKFAVPARVKHKAITAGVVGGILFFIVAIILSVCAVKICNKRKRRKQEKAYNMVACRITDTRNGANATESQVPLKKRRARRVPGVRRRLAPALDWVWPRGRCWRRGASRRRLGAGAGAPLARIARAPDGRFVVAAAAPSPTASLSTATTDDGGFLAPIRGRPVALLPPPPPRSSSPGWPPPLFATDLSSVHLRYSRELPSLRALQAAARARPRRPSADPPDRSPESRSSSSGFGSKNTSSQPPTTLHGSSSADWRPPPPPYRPPPPPPSPGWPPSSSSPPPPNAERKTYVAQMDAGSVDGHYEFDGGSPTPTPSADGARRLDDIDARVRAMKEEFHEFRKRQASRRGAPALESAC